MGRGTDLSLAAARRAFHVVSSYWPLFSTPEQTAIDGWLASLQQASLEQAGLEGIESDTSPRLEISRGQLLCCFGTGSLARLLPERILRSDTHPFLRQASDSSGAPISPILRQQMIADLRRWQQVFSHLPDFDEAVQPSELSLESVAPDPFGRGRNPWSAEAAGRQLLTDFPISEDWGALVDPLEAFVRAHGAGPSQGCVAFRLEGSGGQALLQPIEEFAAFDLDWLEGNEKRISVLERNTRYLLDGYHAHNCLVWGPRGCGKSSVIRGLITRYWEGGLRGVEVPHRSYQYLPQLFDLVRGRRERFIAVLDNIAMERTDPYTRMLSVALDGGLESAPANLVFYATSNFKDLVDRGGERPQGPPAMQADAAPGEIRHTDSQSKVRRGFDPQGFQRLDERRALDDRFALKIFLDLPTKSEYDRIVVAYARRAGLDLPEVELLDRFQKWRMRHNHDLVGGRTARDFVLSCYPDAG